MMPIVWTTGSTTAGTVSNLNISSVTGGIVSQASFMTNQYATSSVLLYPSTQTTMANGWYQSHVDNYYAMQQSAVRLGQMLNQNAYHPRPDPPAHVAAARVVGARARRLLMSVLSPAQRQTYEDKRYFDVQVAGKVYRIHQGTHGNVRELGPDGRERYLWCAQPDHVPTEDAMLAQMLLLKHDEAAFRRVANRRPI